MSRFPLRLLLPLLLLATGLARSQDSAFYEGETPVDSQSEAHRIAALPRALAHVLVKVTGDPAARADAALVDARGLLEQYRYRQDVVTEYGVPKMKTFLIARFNRDAIEGLAAGAGRSLWPTPRPRPLLWLAIDDGRGPRLVGEAQAGAVAALTRRAAERGLAFGFPKADLQDQTLGGAQAVWRDDVGAVRSAATRYGSELLLLGRMQRGDAGWNAQWVLVDGGVEVKRWSAVDADAAQVLASGADGAASALAQNYATRILSGPAGDYDIVVEGLAQADDYARVLHCLQGLSIVSAVAVQEATADRLLLRVSLRTGIEGLARLTQNSRVLQPPDSLGEGIPVFRLEP
jgi:uncharacterized protein